MIPLPIDAKYFRPVSIRASAGSGKTFQLTNRYLKLIAIGMEPSSILASTFTRLAAGQIRDRILFRLAKAIDDDKERAELARHLHLRSVSRDSLLAMLENLTSNLHRMQIRTLDSFFASVIQAFAIELDLPIGAPMVDENQARQMRAEAIRLMLDERQPQDLVDLLRLLSQGSTQRSVMKTIDDIVTKLHSIYLEADEEKWECVPLLPVLPEDDVNAAIESLKHFQPPKDKNWEKAHAAAIDKAWTREWSEFIGGGIAAKIIAGEENFSRKPIGPDVLAAYEPLIAHARGVLVGRVRDQTIATRDLLRLFHAQYEAVKHQSRAITFADLTAAMVQAQQIGQLDDIGYRLDATLRHLLLDEFQDTSVAQWRALQPIAGELVSNAYPERTFFCVGDVKQSIYGWRGAEPEVLDALPNLLSGPDGSSAIDEIELATSYRSSQPVIDVVNRVFDALETNPALGDFSNAVAAWKHGFSHHSTHKATLPGYAELRVTPRMEKGLDKQKIRLGLAADLAIELHNQNPELVIAILTRTNKAVAALMHELGPSQRNIAGGVSGRGGGPLTDAPAVNAILDLLTIADHPHDTIAAFNVANSPLGRAIEFTNHENAGALDQLARTVRHDLMAHGYARTIAKWVQQIAPSCDARELRRVLQLVELATVHDQTASANPLRTDEFIENVENTEIGDAQAAAVQVMTVHQSKGLEFDVVILPELEGKITGTLSPPIVYERENEIGPVTRICRYMNQKTLELVPELQPLFDRHENRTVRESLSVLYVAMTRAIHGLYMLVDAPDINKSGSLSEAGLKTAAGILRNSLIDGELKAGEINFSHGDPNWIARAKPTKQSAVMPPSTMLKKVVLAPSTGDAWRQRGAAATAASRLSLQPEVAGTNAFSIEIPRIEAQHRGVAIHALFEKIQWLEEFNPDESALAQVVLKKFPRRTEAWARQQVTTFRSALQHDAVRKTLSRGEVPGNSSVLHRELPFARQVKDGIQSGYIDRMVVKQNTAGGIESVSIIDFKTDAVDETQARASAEKYKAQMETYRSAAAEMLNIEPKRISVGLLFVSPGILISL